jgi:hypothetical protein
MYVANHKKENAQSQKSRPDLHWSLVKSKKQDLILTPICTYKLKLKLTCDILQKIGLEGIPNCKLARKQIPFCYVVNITSQVKRNDPIKTFSLSIVHLFLSR